MTASLCGNIAEHRSTTKVANAVKILLYPTFRGNTAIEWGNSKDLETLGAMRQQHPQPLSAKLDWLFTKIKFHDFKFHDTI